jgi:hypothetical protein
MHIATDGLIRISIDELLSTTICHLLSGLDAATENPKRDCGRLTHISGFTDWSTGHMSPMLLGWDWRMVCISNQFHMRKIGLPRTNIQLIESNGRDTHWHKNLEYISTIIDSLSWKGRVQLAIEIKYIK